MGTATNRTTKEYLRSINTPDYPTIDWIINSSEANTLWLAGVQNKYWNIVGDLVSEMSQAEKDAVDAAEAAAIVTSNRSEAVSYSTDNTGNGFHLREIIELFNKRDNYIINRVAEIHTMIQDMQSAIVIAANFAQSQTNVNNVDTTPLATNTRTRAQAVQEYTDDINAGTADN